MTYFFHLGVTTKKWKTFIADQWRSNALREQFNLSKTIYLTANEKCCYLTKSNAKIVPELHSNEREADTDDPPCAACKLSKFLENCDTLDILTYSL